MAWNIVIAGGGFGGYYAARTLERTLPPHSARVTLVNDVNFMLYTPLLPGAAAGTLEPRHVVVPLREQLTTTDLRLGRVSGADPDARRARPSTARAAAPRSSHYDQLIVALGSISRTLPIPGLAEHAIGFKTLSEAIALRNRAAAQLEMAETVDDAETRARSSSRSSSSAPATPGVEGLAELQDFAADVIDLYPRCRVAGHALDARRGADRVMPEVPPTLAAFADARAARPRHRDPHEHDGRGGHRPQRALSGGEAIPTRTVVWTAGVKPHPVVARARACRSTTAAGSTSTRHARRAAPTTCGRSATPPPCPTRRARASRRRRPPSTRSARGERVARNVAAALGRGTAGAVPLQDARRVRRHGPPPGGGQHAGHPLARLPRVVPGPHLPPGDDAGYKRQLRLVVDWTVDLLFGRDASELGQLGHPPARAEEHEQPGTPADGGRRRPPCRALSLDSDRRRTGEDRPDRRHEGGREGARRRAAHGALRAAEGGQGGRRTTRSRCCAASASAASTPPSSSATAGAPSWPTQEEGEAELIAGYLPAELSDEELRRDRRRRGRRDGRELAEGHGQGDEGRDAEGRRPRRRQARLRARPRRH